MITTVKSTYDPIGYVRQWLRSVVAVVLAVASFVTLHLGEAKLFASTRSSRRVDAKWRMSVGKNRVDRICAQASMLRALVLVTSATLRAANPQEALGPDICSGAIR